MTLAPSRSVLGWLTALLIGIAGAGAPAANAGSVTPRLDAATAEVARQSDGIRAMPGRRMPRAYTVSMVAAQYVRAHVSAAAYASPDGLPRPGIDAERALELGVGICGHQVEVFLRILERLGIRAAPVLLLFRAPGRQSHVAAEVWWAGRAHFVDVSYAAVWRDRRGDLLSLPRIRALKHPLARITQESTDSWVDSARRKGWQPLAYLRRGVDLQVVRQGSGVISPAPPPSRARSHRLDLTLMPDWVGSQPSFGGHLTTISWRLPPGRGWLVVQTRGGFCAGGGVLELDADAGRRSISLASIGDLSADVRSVALRLPEHGSRLSIRPRRPGAHCMLLLTGLRMAPAPPSAGTVASAP